MLEYGEGVKCNYSETNKYYKIAIELCNDITRSNYAHMLKNNNKGIERN